MKRAVVIGGTNGVGLAISQKLIERGYFVEVYDKSNGDVSELSSRFSSYTYCDLLEFDEQLFTRLAGDERISLLFITAGIGRVADFQAHHIAEIDNMLTVDAVSIIKILRIFYDRVLSDESFFTGVMGSISGWISSPAASVYAGAKAALVRTVESINIELEAAGSPNRILDVSPASFKGSSFYGGENNLSVMEPMAESIISHLFNRDTRYIPQYEPVFRTVIERYHSDPHEYGIYSYQYKKASGRFDNSRRVKIGYLSGTFDLFHVGHLNLLRRAKKKCDYLIVGVHSSGSWKGKETFIPLDERKAIVGACSYVDKVVDSCREDSDAWSLWHYDLLFVGTDYKGTDRFMRYEKFFEDKNVEIVYLPYTQGTSSTQIRHAVIERTNTHG